MKRTDRATSGVLPAGPAVVLGARRFAALPGDTILRCFERAVGRCVSEGNYCSTGECLHCEVTIRRGSAERSVLACMQPVTDELSVVALSRYLERDLRR